METLLFVLASLSFLLAGAYLFRPRHLAFVVFLFMNWVVFFLAPWTKRLLERSVGDDSLCWPWIVLLGAFYLPLFVLYLRFSGRGGGFAPQPTGGIRRGGTALYCAASLVFAAAFFAVAARNGLIFMRVGHAGLAERFVSMSLPEHAVLRLFVELLPLLLPANMLLFRLVRLGALEKAGLAVFVLVGWLQILVNSRFDALIVVLVLLVLLVAAHPPRRGLLGRALRFAAVVAVLIVAVSYGRATYMERVVGQAAALERAFARSQWLDRADGMSMIGDIHDGAAGKGFMWGAAWEHALKLNYYFLFDRPRYAQIKLGLRTNPKVLIAEKYRGVEVADTPSSFLDDLYANFSVLGLLLGALVFAYVLDRASRAIDGARIGGVAFFVGVWAVIRALYLDNEFLSMLIVFFKFLPLVVVFALLYPAKAVALAPAARGRGVVPES